MRVTFGPFTFDAGSRQLFREGEPVHLSPKAFDLLGLLLKHRPEAVAKSELHRELWPNTFVSDASLAVLAAELRRALGESWPNPGFIRTVNRFGYAFADGGETRAPGGDAAPAGYVRTASGERIRLKRGDNVIGRDPDADVYIDGLGVSRRHAVIVVADDHVTLRDLESKNGTYADGVRVLSAVPLQHNAEIKVGAITLRLHRPANIEPTATVVNPPNPQGTP